MLRATNFPDQGPHEFTLCCGMLKILQSLGKAHFSWYPQTKSILASRYGIRTAVTLPTAWHECTASCLLRVTARNLNFRGLANCCEQRGQLTAVWRLCRLVNANLRVSESSPACSRTGRRLSGCLCKHLARPLKVRTCDVRNEVSTFLNGTGMAVSSSLLRRSMLGP